MRSCARYCLSCLSKNLYFEEACFSGHLCAASFHYAFVLIIIEYCSPVCGSAEEYQHRLLERQVYSVTRLCPDLSFLSFCH